ncbi:leucine-rich repeat domain-containing protein [Chryseobacterium aquaticum]|uniref:TIR domain-containing protein n=1 Tax=Chryseobacterium aquaticum subsp. greenlandense TaxID=345663 RepID=A0A101CHT6_9FLAO|nr:leucine-rich repeat domain-containing protein [Chryseobacterium aquaticum]KUJ56479.1 hypothetical protein AR686_07920 [Chryseobacterium aquaticum subsp. greenlandense]
MQNKTPELIEIEKIFEIEINDFSIENNNIECITFENIKFDNQKINHSIKYLLSLKRLFIYNCEIETTFFINNLLSLEELTISNSDLKNFEINNLDNKITLLSLSDNQISEISFLSNFKNLKNLSLDNNRITDISPLKNFKMFEEISLKNNQIEDIIPLNNLEIDELFISENNIMDLTPLYHSLKNKKIKFINAFENPLVYPPEEVVIRGEENMIKWFEMISGNIKVCKQKIESAKTSKEKKIDLGMMGLTDLSLIPELFELEDLEELILSNHWAEFNIRNNEWEPEFSDNDFYSNNIINIPNDITKLKKLRKLIAGGDWKKNNVWNRWRIKDISFINKLDNIEFVNLSNNKIDSFKITRNLNNLQTVHINNNYIKSISISKARNLEYLFASNNLITDLNFLKKSMALKAIDLHSNFINDLYPIRELISKLGIINDQWGYNSISIANNDLENPGMEVVDRGKDAVLRIIESNFGIKTFKNDELKLILVGNSETGKTTLSKYLAKDPNYKNKHPFTLWMDILEISYKNLKINVFDFGGHEYFHDTHHIFFTSNCIYFLIWDKSTDKYQTRDLNQIDRTRKKIKLQTIDYPLFYWLDSIKHFIRDETTDNFSDEMKNIVNENNSETYNASALIIQNKVKVCNDLKFLNHEDISKSYSFIYDYITIDLHNDKNLELLNDRFDEMIQNLGILSGGKYPLYYKKIKENISQNKSYLNKKVLSFNEFKRLCQTFNRRLTTDVEYLDIAYFLENIGLILISKDEKTLYLDLNFVSSQIVKIYDSLEKTNGILKEREIKQKNIDEYVSILKLILDFNLAFEITTNKEKNYIFPLFLPENPSKIVDLLFQKNLKPYKRIQYEGFMHKGIILHIFSEYSNKIVNEEVDKNTYYWKNGLIVKEGNNLVLIKFFEGNESQDAHIDLYNFSSNEDFIEKIKEKIIKINKEKKYNVEEYVSKDGDNFIPLKLINDNEGINSTIFYKGIYYKLYDFKKYFKNKNIMKKIFISYSKDDLTLVNEFIDHLSALKRDGLVGSWYCTELLAGGYWDKDIQKHFDESDIICIMISPNLMKTDYIHKYEITKAFEKLKENENFKIVPIILNYCRWTTKNNNLSQFTALPYTAKPVNDFKDRNMAWFIIIECMRIMIEKQVQPKGEDWYSNNDLLPKDIRKIYERIVNGLIDNNSI